MAEACHYREILFVEDDLIDAMSVRRVLREIGVSNVLTHVADGRQALTFLRDPARRKPCAILLDLDLPRMTGLEFLEAVSADESLRHIPVIIVTMSNRREDWARSFELGAVACVIKCSNYEEFRRKIQELKPYFSPAGVAGYMSRTQPQQEVT